VGEPGMTLFLLRWLLRQTAATAAGSQMLRKKSLACLTQWNKSFPLLKSAFCQAGGSLMSEAGRQCQVATVL